MEAADIGVHAQTVESGTQELGRVGVILEQLGIGAEADEKREILLAQYGAKELIGGVLFDLDEVHLAGADIDQQADGEREIGLAIEVLDGLFFAILEDLEVVFL